MTPNEFETIKAVLIEKFNEIRPALGIAVTTPIVAQVSIDSQKKIGCHVHVSFGQEKTIQLLLAGRIAIGDISLRCIDVSDCLESTWIQFDWVRTPKSAQLFPPIVVDNSMFTMDNPYNMNLGNN